MQTHELAPVAAGVSTWSKIQHDTLFRMGNAWLSYHENKSITLTGLSGGLLGGWIADQDLLSANQ